MTDQDGDGMIDAGRVAGPTEDPDAHGRSLRDAATLTAIVGLAFSVLFSVAFWLTMSIPGLGRPTRS